MIETVLLVVLIVVLFLTTVVSVIAMVRLRRKADTASGESLDAGFEICISELNKLGNLIKSDLDAKYKEILFLYDLIEDKHKQIDALVKNMRKSFDDVVEEAEVKEVMPAYEELYNFEEFVPQRIPEPYNEPAQIEPEHPRSFVPDHKAILQMSEQGLAVADIAKELGIGQGEVKLILNIANK